MRLLVTISFMCLTTLIMAQGWITKGARVVLKNDVHVVINTADGNYLNKSDGLITTTNGGTMYVRGNWINNGSTAAIGNNGGTVVMDGDSQRITGTALTRFNNLTLRGNGDKYMDLNTLVGGGYAGGPSGQLDLGTRNMIMPGNKLIVNNKSTNAITTSTGLLLGETNGISGYTIVQWNIRNTPAGSVFTVPFGSVDLIQLPISAVINAAGTQSTDSGYISFATYPTNSSMSPNNRPLPNGVTNFNNQYAIENDIKAADRFYIMESQGYSTHPMASLELPYIDREWDASNSSTNLIIEKDLKAAKYNFSSNSWDYTIDGSTNTLGNFTSTEMVSNMSGAWILFNNPPCPVARFNVANACREVGILAIDSSSVTSGWIDKSVWSTQLSQWNDIDTLSYFYPSSGKYDIQRKVRSDRGCWDSITKSVTVWPMPIANFKYSDTCINDLTTFNATSTSSTGLPITNTWLINGSSTNGNKVYYTFLDTGLKNVRLISQNQWGCVDTIYRTAEIQPAPEVMFTFNDICEKENAFFLNATLTKGIIKQQRWSVNDVVASFGQDYNQVFNNRGGYDIKLKVTNSFGCFDSLTQSIVVKPRAKANFSFFPQDIFITDPYVNFVQQTTNANIWEWEMGDFSPTEYGPEVFHTYGDTGVFSIRLIAGNDENCPDTIFKAIRIKPYLRIYIPNAFSPGEGNTLNNTFAPAGMLYGLKEMTMDIYNRWGEQLYHSEDINQPWDGTYLGKPVKEGTYLYMIKIKDIYNQVAWHQGTVTVVR